jgi:hypothetical protein
MVKLCMSIWHTTLCIPCIAFMLASHNCTFVIDHVEQGRAEPPEIAPVEGADYEQDHDKPGASNHNS